MECSKECRRWFKLISFSFLCDCAAQCSFLICVVIFSVLSAALVDNEDIKAVNLASYRYIWSSSFVLF